MHKVNTKPVEGWYELVPLHLHQLKSLYSFPKGKKTLEEGFNLVLNQVDPGSRANTDSPCKSDSNHSETLSDAFFRKYLV